MDVTPLARSTDLIIEELDSEVLVYDTRTKIGHSLGSEAAKVWQACDGETPADELAAKLGLEADTVARALDELGSRDLLEEPPTLFPVPEGSTRREASVRLAKVGAAAVAAPLIYSVAVPPASLALGSQCLQFSNQSCGTVGQAGEGCKSENGCCCCQPNGCAGSPAANAANPGCKVCVTCGDPCPDDAGNFVLDGCASDNSCD
jgi:hypothetical protein